MAARVTRSRGATATKAPKRTSTAATPSKPEANISKKRKRDAVVKDEPKDETPPGKAKKGKTSSSKAPSAKDLEAGAKMAEGFQKTRDAQRDEPEAEHKARTKANPYGLSPGETPFPKYDRPTPEECHEVRNILAKVHGDISAPKTIPTPSLNSSGCGEVPSVLDALVRTRLSAATNNQNSSRAFKGLVDRFGLLKSGIGKGSVDWNAVRKAPQKDVFEAIKSGGLADVKSRDIKKILDMVYEENQERKENIKQEGKGSAADAAEEDGEEKQSELAKADAQVLSLDHLHLLSNEDAFQKLLGYPGIGPKTASCVLLFCMQRPSFAVDTHVFRLTKWLGWVPTEQKAKAMAKAEAKETGEKVKSATVTREKTYAHLDVRIPDDLKYPLHYLLIKHGKHCPWCSAKAGAASKVGTCPVAHLMTGKGRNKGLAKGVKSEVEDEADEEDEEEQEQEEDDDVEVKSEEEGVDVKSEEEDIDVKDEVKDESEDEEMHGNKV